MPHDLEPRVVKQVVYVAPGPGEEIVDAEHIAADFQQTFTQMRADEARSARHKNALRRWHCV